MLVPEEDGALRVRASVGLRGFELDVDLSVRPGERLAIVGPSGAGKTTILRLIAGLKRPSDGRISLGAEPFFDASSRVDVAPEKRGCGYLFQDYALFPGMSSWRNVAYGMRSVPRSIHRSKAVDLLGRFGVADLADAKPATLSGGERQRVALARVLASDPRVLLFDEPLSALDSSTRARSLRELDRTLAESGRPAVIVTHSFDEAALLGDRVAVLDRGRIVQIGTAGEVSARPASAFVADFAGAVVLEGDALRIEHDLTVIGLDGGGELRSVDRAEGRVAISVFPWEISLESPGSEHRDSALNRVSGEVVSVTTVGNRVRVGLAIPQLLTAEVTSRSAESMGLSAGVGVTATWKATATRLIGRGPGDSQGRHHQDNQPEETCG